MTVNEAVPARPVPTNGTVDAVNMRRFEQEGEDRLSSVWYRQQRKVKKATENDKEDKT